MKTKTNKNTTLAFYKERFKNICEGQIIAPTSKNGKPLIFTRKGMKWLPLYSSKSTARKDLPKHLFISNQGDVITVYDEEPLHLCPYPNKGKYPRIGSGNDHSYGIGKPLYISALVALIFHSQISKRAYKLLTLKGFEAFGRGVDHQHVTVHHKDRNTFNNTPDNLVIMTRLEHICVHAWENGLSKFRENFWDMSSEKLSKRKQKKYAKLFA